MFKVHFRSVDERIIKTLKDGSKDILFFMYVDANEIQATKRRL